MRKQSFFRTNDVCDRVTIGRRIAQRREQRGMTQHEFARALKTSQSAVARMEKGEQNFSTNLLGHVAHVLGKDIVTLSNDSLTIRIEGGHPLSGTVTTNTSKNAAVALLCAALVNTNKTVLKKMPRIEEVKRIIEVLVSVGVSVKRLDNDDIEITPPRHITLDTLDRDAAVKTRSALMLLGPLVHLLPEFSLPYPGGCKLGTRTVRPFLLALESLGLRIKVASGSYHVTQTKLKSAEIVLYESGDTVTECVLMAAARIPGTTVIKYASANYQVQDVCHFLQALGIHIDGIGTTTLTVHGKQIVDVPVVYYPSEDPIESMLFLSLAATTHSALTIERCPIDFLELELLKLKIMGFRYKITKRYLARNGFTKLVNIQTCPSTLKALEEKIYARPYPGLNIDNLPFFVPIATQAKGRTLIHDWVFENRALYYTELSKLGAAVLLADPHRVYIDGPTDLHGAEIICPPALRPSAIILVAMLAAQGTSILRNIYSINRGYEDLVSRLVRIGAHIEVL